MSVVEVFFIILVVRFVFRIIMVLFVNSKKTRFSDELEKRKLVQNRADELNSSKDQEKIKPVEMVQCENCGDKISKNKAYIVVRDNKRYYFSSWECRQEFINNNPQNSRQGRTCDNNKSEQ